MFSLFRLLFSSAYWVTLLRGETWRRTGVSLRRAHKDARARKQLRQMLLLLLTPFLCIAYLGWILGSAPGLIGAAAALVVMGAVALYRNARPVENDGPLTLSLTTYEDAKPAPPPEASPELRRELAERALLTAVLIDRAGSENFLRSKVLPEGTVVITRQRHMEVLREYKLYERLGTTERDLMLLPDGHWEPEAIERIAMELEPLRLLRWVLRVDAFLPTVGGTMVPEFRLASSLVQNPAPLFQADSLIGIDSLRTALAAADQYLYRCWAEGLERGFYVETSTDEQRKAIEYARRLKGNETADLLLGTVIVSRAPNEQVGAGIRLSLRRLKVLNWVRARMYGEAPAAENVELLA